MGRSIATWVDNIHADLPDPNEEPELGNLISTYQIHRYSKTCRKYKREKCRFYFRKYFTSCKIIAEPLPNDIPEKLKVKVMKKKKKILRKENSMIQQEMMPKK